MSRVGSWRWVETSLRRTLTVAERHLVDILSVASGRGPYDYDGWDRLLTSERYINGARFSFWGTFATWDNSHLTRAVFLAHDRCVRLSLGPAGRNTEIRVFTRRGRDGGMSARHPTLETAVREWRRYNPPAELETGAWVQGIAGMVEGRFGLYLADPIREGWGFLMCEADGQWIQLRCEPGDVRLLEDTWTEKEGE